MNKKFLLKLVQIWWEGFKVACRLGALGIVLTIFFLLALGLTILSGEYAGRILIVVLAVFVFPIVLYPTSRYLLLLDGNGALMLSSARLRHIAGTRWGTRRYMNMARLREFKHEQESLLGAGA